MKRCILYGLLSVAFLLVTTGKVIAQFGGQSSFQFLNIPTHARLAALGGVNVSAADQEINFLFSNPALVSDSLAGWASASYLFHVADIGQASFAFAHDFKKIGTLSFGIQHLSYGEIEGYDGTGMLTDSYASGETALLISKSHQVSYFRLGTTVKTVFSNLAGFRSTAMMLDLGGVFIHPHKALTIGLALKNIGVVLSDYSETNSARIPFDVQAGITYKPEYMPLRFSLTAYNLAQPGELYDDPNNSEEVGVVDKMMSHLAIGTEILLHRNFNARLGYNHLRQKELQVESGGGGSGFTFGVAARIKSFDISISNSRYGVGNSNYTFTLAANLQTMIFRKSTL
jgi:hypothetical protein